MTLSILARREVERMVAEVLDTMEAPATGPDLDRLVSVLIERIQALPEEAKAGLVGFERVLAPRYWDLGPFYRQR